MDNKYTVNIKDPLQENFEETENIDKQTQEIPFSKERLEYLQNFIKSIINKQNHQKITLKDLEQAKMENKLWWIKHKRILVGVLFLVAIFAIPFILSFVNDNYKNLFETLYKSIFAIYTIIFSAFIGGLLDRHFFKNKSNN